VVSQTGVKSEAQENSRDDRNNHNGCNDKLIVVRRIIWSRSDAKWWSHGRAIEYLVLQTTKYESQYMSTCSSYRAH
jgi:hypothetical protein